MCRPPIFMEPLVDMITSGIIMVGMVRFEKVEKNTFSVLGQPTPCGLPWQKHAVDIQSSKDWTYVCVDYIKTYIDTQKHGINAQQCKMAMACCLRC